MHNLSDTFLWDTLVWGRSVISKTEPHVESLPIAGAFFGVHAPVRATLQREREAPGIRSAAIEPEESIELFVDSGRPQLTWCCS